MRYVCFIVSNQVDQASSESMSCTRKTNSTRKTFCNTAKRQKHYQVGLKCDELQDTNPTSRDPAWTKQAQWKVQNPSEDLSLHHPKPSNTIQNHQQFTRILATIAVKGTLNFTCHCFTFSEAILLRGAKDEFWLPWSPEDPVFCCLACRCSAVSARTLAEWSLSQSWSRIFQQNRKLQRDQELWQCIPSSSSRRASTFFEAVSLLSNCLFSPLHCSFLDTRLCIFELLVLVSQNNLSFEGHRNF